MKMNNEQHNQIIGTNWKDKRVEELTPEDFNKIGR